MDNKIRDSILKKIGKVVQIGMVLIFASAVAVGQDRIATAEKSNTMVYNGVPITQDAAKSAVLNKIISINLQDISLLEAVEKIALKAQLEMVYNSKLLEKKSRSITTNLKQITVAKALWAVLEGTGLRFAVSADKQLVLLKQKEAKNSLQRIPATIQKTITGTVTDGQSGKTLPGVNILVKGTATGASTNENGNFELTVPSLQDTLVFTYVGYQTQEVPVNGRTEIDIQLTPEAIMAEEMVVVGYGTQQRQDVTGAVSSVSAEDFEERPITNTALGLQGLSPGLSIEYEGGQPGEENVVTRIRGTGTLNNPNPLVLVDGVEQSLATVEPSNIESISVLKDAASAAIYGSRAANGVILVTTKRGAESGVAVSYNANVSVHDLLFFLDGASKEDWMMMRNEADIARGNDPVFTEEYQSNVLAGTNPLEYPFADFEEGVFRDRAFAHSNTISVSTGGETGRLYAAISHDDQDGIMKNRSEEHTSELQ